MRQDRKHLFLNLVLYDRSRGLAAIQEAARAVDYREEPARVPIVFVPDDPALAGALLEAVKLSPLHTKQSGRCAPSTSPYLAIAFLSVGTLGVLGSMPIFWPIPSAFLAGTASAAGIGLVNSIGNLGGYVGPNLPVWAKAWSQDPSAALHLIAGVLLVGAVLTFFAIPRDLHVRVGHAPERRVTA